MEIKKYIPTALFVVGCMGVVGTAICSGRDTLKAEDILKNEHKVKMIDDNEPECYADNAMVVTLCNTKPEYYKEIVKVTWKSYIPTFIVGTMTLSCLIASNVMDAKKIAALTALVSSSTGLVTKYREKIKEYVSEEKLHEIDKAVASDEIIHAKSPTITTSSWTSCSDEMDLNTDGEVLFFDPFTKMKFKTTKLAFLGAKYYLNRNFSIGCGAPLSMFYEFLGLEIPEEYRYAGWDMDDFRDDGYMWIDIDVVKSDEPDPETGEKYYIIEYEFAPGDTEYSYSFYPAGNPLDEFGSVVTK